LYTIDTQVHHLGAESLLKLGKWMERKWRACQACKFDALTVLETVGIESDILQSEWKAQLKEQTKPLTKQSNSLGSKAVKDIVSLMTTKAELIKELDSLNDMLLQNNYDDLSDLMSLQRAVLAKIADLNVSIAKKQDVLGINDQADLKKLVNNKFLQV
ncbi:hypothetical protein DXG01_006439, partial [Tephrocybe rancida]